MEVEVVPEEVPVLVPLVVAQDLPLAPYLDCLLSLVQRDLLENLLSIFQNQK